jgi:hypothetical protein
VFRTRENIRFINFDSVVIILVIFFGLLVYTGSSVNTNETRKKPVETTTSFNEHCALSTPIARLQIYQKTWVSNKDNFNLLAFNRNPLSENKVTNIRVSQLRLLRQSLPGVPQFILRYHLFPREMDDLPLLS